MTSIRIAALVVLSIVGSACATGPDQADVGGTGTGTEGESTGDTDGDVCVGFEDTHAEPGEQLVVHNARTEPIYLVTLNDCTFNYVHVTGAAGHWPAGNCESICAQNLAGECGCPESCAAPVLLRIEPGGDYPLEWTYVLAADELPLECVSGDSVSGRRVRARYRPRRRRLRGQRPGGGGPGRLRGPG